VLPMQALCKNGHGVAMEQGRGGVVT
jgi:hypothetical protein